MITDRTTRDNCVPFIITPNQMIFGAMQLKVVRFHQVMNPCFSFHDKEWGENPPRKITPDPYECDGRQPM